MNYTLTDTLGIDVAIQNVQTKLYTLLKNRWANKDIDGYGRVHDVNEVPRWFNIDTKDYEDVYLDDRISANFSFIPSASSDTDDGYAFVNDVKVVFIVNLETLFIDGVGRQDERAHRDALEALRTIMRAGGISEIDNVQVGIENVFRGFDQSLIKLDDMHPYHIFAVNVVLPYSLKDKC